jgi:polyhydroxybutyrate depolymerase
MAILVAVLLTGLGYYFLLARYAPSPLRITPGPVQPAAGNYLVSLEVGGFDRKYYLHVPPAIARREPLPVVLVLHGGGGDARILDGVINITTVADREGFYVAFPQAYAKHWNDGREVHSEAREKGVDDVAFLLAIVQDVIDRLPVDSHKIYISGMSNGAFMAGRVACEAADTFAAAGLVAGTSYQGFADQCQPGRPVPIAIFLGTNDEIVPFEGGGRGSRRNRQAGESSGRLGIHVVLVSQ